MIVSNLQRNNSKSTTTYFSLDSHLILLSYFHFAGIYQSYRSLQLAKLSNQKLNMIEQIVCGLVRNWMSLRLPPHHSRFTALFRDHPGEPVPEQDFWTLWCKKTLTEADTPTIRLGATPSGLTSTMPPFLQAGCPSCRPTNSVKALKATIAFLLG